MGKSYSKNNEKLVYGYVRRHESKYYIPESISHLVLTYYPDTNIFGIGRNGLSEFGLGDFRRLPRFEVLSHMTQYCDDPKDIYVGEHRFVVKNIHGELYCAGKNTNNDTGCFGPDMLKSLEKIKGIQATDQNQWIIAISSGLSARHTFVAYNDNTVFAFGWNQYGQFGNGRQDAYAKLFRTKLSNPWRLKQIACGHTHSLFLTTHGNVYVAGMNQLGQCGIAVTDYQLNCILQMIPVPELINIVSIACGHSHSLCLDKDGKVWTFGNNEQGQLGFMNEDMMHMAIQTPIIQETLDSQKSKIGIIRCGKNHSLFIDTDRNEAYLCGDNIHGQIGNNKKDISQVFMPCWFRFDGYTNKIIDGSCGERHTVLMTTDNNVLLAFGSNVCHQCSSQSNVEYMFEPYRLTASEIGITNKREVICNVICGNDTTLIATRGL